MKKFDRLSDTCLQLCGGFLSETFSRASAIEVFNFDINNFMTKRKDLPFFLSLEKPLLCDWHFSLCFHFWSYNFTFIYAVKHLATLNRKNWLEISKVEPRD